MRSLSFLLVMIAVLSVPQGAPAAPDVQVDRVLEKDQGIVPVGFTVRARVTAIDPAEPVTINWRHGGEGLGGKSVSGTFGEKLEIEEWSPAVSVRSVMPGGGKFPAKFFLTCTAGNGGKLEKSEAGRERGMVGGSKNVHFEFEFRWNDKVVKTLKETGPTGGTVGLVIPAGLLSEKCTPADPKFLENLRGLLEYSKSRADRLEGLPWAKQPVPKKYAIQTDLGGYGQGIYYGIRTSDPGVIEAECRTLRQLGINGLRNAPGFLLDRVEKRDALGESLSHIRDIAAMGFPVTHAQKGKTSDPGAGCPFAPGVAERTRIGIEETVEQMSRQPVAESWGLTVDEIGSVFDHAPEGKGHLATCPRCAEAFRAHLKAAGLTPADFRKADWSEVAPMNIYEKEFHLDAPDRPIALLAYHTAMFPNEASAKLFTPLRDKLASLNDEKRQAFAAGQTNAAAARPWLYSYALRGNTFLMGGHSLDFFDFYRWSDNAFVYETSNRDPRVWQWDSYLCDVGRVMSAERNLRFGIYVKPHRGAPIQRALTAAARGAKMLYWYTYGPDWAKGDTFAADDEALDLTSKAARLLAAAEDVTYGATWPTPPEVAIVTPRSSEIWMRLSGNAPDRVAAWENAKWTYTALAHAHIPVDPLDEGMLAEKSLTDLSHYKVMYILGPNLTTAAAEKVAKWVEAGGVLYTSAGGLRFDEANQPLTALQNVLGVGVRKVPPQMWKRVQLYGATHLESWDEVSRTIAPVPKEAAIASTPSLPAALTPVVGREILDPATGTEILARFADGDAAVTRHPFGKGMAYVAGVFAGLEYSAPMRNPEFDGSQSISPAAHALVKIAFDGRIKPIVDCNVPRVEGILVENPESKRRAVFVIDWPTSEKNREPSASRGVTLTIQGRVPLRVTDVATGGNLEPKAVDGGFRVVLPELSRGTVLLLDDDAR